jgi:predicted anti-sigma-YlaC factor YlaD
MNEHFRIRELLALYQTDSLSKEEEVDIAQHLLACSDCRAEHASLVMIAGDLKLIARPQPSLGLAQRTRFRIAAEMAAKAERRQHQRLLAWVIGFAWIFTGLTFAVGRFLVLQLAARLRISPETCMTVFIAYSILAGTASVAFTGMMATRHRNERRLV